MPKTILVAIKDIDRDFTIYPRHSVNPGHVAQLAEALNAGAVFPPVIVDRENRLIDGFHRVAATQIVNGEDADISASRQTFKTDADAFLAAIAANAQHGQRLTPWDQTRAITRGMELGLTTEEVAKELDIRIETADKLVMSRVAGSGDVLKRTVAHLAGKDLTPAQRDMNRRAGGMDQSFYVNQVIALLETDSIDWDKARVIEGLTKLRDLLNAATLEVAA